MNLSLMPFHNVSIMKIGPIIFVLGVQLWPILPTIVIYDFTVELKTILGQCDAIVVIYNQRAFIRFVTGCMPRNL